MIPSSQNAISALAIPTSPITSAEPSPQILSSEVANLAASPTGFVAVLLALLHDEQLRDVIGWSADGTHVLVYSVREFIDRIMPVYFKTSNVKSFVRQLNLYGFHKLSGKQLANLVSRETAARNPHLRDTRRASGSANEDVMGFFHVDFRRSNPDLWRTISRGRKVSTSEATLSPASSSSGQLPSSPSDSPPMGHTLERSGSIGRVTKRRSSQSLLSRSNSTPLHDPSTPQQNRRKLVSRSRSHTVDMPLPHSPQQVSATSHTPPRASHPAAASNPMARALHRSRSSVPAFETMPPPTIPEAHAAVQARAHAHVPATAHMPRAVQHGWQPTWDGDAMDLSPYSAGISAHPPQSRHPMRSYSLGSLGAHAQHAPSLQQQQQQQQQQLLQQQQQQQQQLAHAYSPRDVEAHFQSMDFHAVDSPFQSHAHDTRGQFQSQQMEGHFQPQVTEPHFATGFGGQQNFRQQHAYGGHGVAGGAIDAFGTISPHANSGYISAQVPSHMPGMGNERPAAMDGYGGSQGPAIPFGTSLDPTLGDMPSFAFNGGPEPALMVEGADFLHDMHPAQYSSTINAVAAELFQSVHMATDFMDSA